MDWLARTNLFLLAALRNLSQSLRVLRAATTRSPAREHDNMASSRVSPAIKVLIGHCGRFARYAGYGRGLEGAGAQTSANRSRVFA